ncbi:unnamed protein product, partial [Laminaria digitata]
GTRWLFYVVFDVLYVGGKGAEDEGALDEVVRNAVRDTQAAPHAASTELKAGNLTALPLGVRLKVLQYVVTEKKHRLEIVQRKHVGSGSESERKKQLLGYFDERAIRRNEEGLVVKDLSGHYMIGVGSRKKALWVKMKPEYSEQTGDLDLLILGAGFADGKMRSGLLSRFLLGVAVPNADGSSPPTKFWPVTRVGSGYSQEELEELNARLEGSWKTFDSDPPHFSFKNQGQDKMTKWIAPKDSVCLQVKSMEIVKSNDWPGIFCTMRQAFPRVSHIRLDKGPEACNDTADLAALQACPRPPASLASGGKRSSNHGGSSSRGGGAGGAGKRRKVAGRGRGGGAGGGRQVSELFATDRGDAVSVKQSVFVTQNATLEMCVIGTGFSKAPIAADNEIDSDTWWGCTAPKVHAAGEDEDDALTKQDVEYLIRANGGLVTANPQVGTAFVIVGSKNSITVQNIVAAGKYNVVGYRWVLECIERKVYEFPSMRYFRAMSPDIRAHLSRTKDEYGDDYTEPTNAEALSQMLLNIPEPPRVAEDAGLSWLSPLSTLDEQDRATLMDGPDFVFADTGRCLVYCDLY